MKYLLTISAIIATAIALPNIAVAQFDVSESDGGESAQQQAQQAQQQAQQTQPPVKAQPQYRSPQFKENYFQIDFGIFLQKGSNNDEYRRLSRAQAADILADNGETDLDTDDVHVNFDELVYFRFAYGIHVNPQFAFEFSNIGIAIDTSRSFGDDDSDSLDDSFGDFSNYAINIYEIAGIYYIPVSDKFQFTLRAGFGNYRWIDEDSMPIPENKNGQNFSGTTPTLGIGFDISNVHLEYQQYDLTAIDVYKGEKYQLYDNVGVFTIGYKFRF